MPMPKSWWLGSRSGIMLQWQLSSKRGGPPFHRALGEHWREGGRAGEADHVLQLNGHVLPIELKSGAAGSMKSLHQFMFDKKLEQAVRIDTNPPSVLEVNVRTTQGDKVRYLLVSIPLYLLWNIERITEEAWNVREV
ncbi:MAG: hypothetical protein SFV15_22330 [Polyangiaceae bacterium]|nr:hypothetical protein [Polyangiaceae bacterium]